MRFQLFLFSLLLCTSAFVYSQQVLTPGEIPTQKESELIDDNFIVAALDSLSNLKYFESVENTKSHLFSNKYNFLPNFIPSYPDSVYYYRMQRLDVASPFELTYNNYVKAFIDLYANQKRGTTSRVLGLAQIYFPLIEQQLDMYNLPLELKYLAIVESALNPQARSRVGASGLWQFMYYTGKVYGLEATSFVDDRNDPVKATEAACKHFRDLFNMYHDWLLVLAAYNSGAGNVNKAIRRSGGKMNFWEIRPFLPRETRDYVPAFIAVNYVMNYSTEHNLYPLMPQIVYHETDTVAARSPLTISLLSEKLKIPIDELQYLNPTFRKDFIPATPSMPYYIRLPKKSIADFINNEPALYSAFQLKGYDPNQFLVSAQSDDSYKIITKPVWHKVRKGENIVSIARQYDCSTQEIKKWNRLKKASVYYGQKLVIYTQTRIPVPAPKTKIPATTEVAQNKSDSIPEKPVAVVTKPSITVAEKPIFHVVQSGDNLFKIATKYNITVAQLTEWNNLKGPALIVGHKLRINPPVPVQNVAETRADTNTKAIVAKASPPVSEKPLFHVVQSGDNLFKIATKYNITVAQLTEWNNLKGPSLIVGHKLRINSPDPAQLVANTKTDTNAKATVDNSPGQPEKLLYYTVQTGDTLWSIAEKYEGITVNQIREWNNLSREQNIQVGQKLKVILSGG